MKLQKIRIAHRDIKPDNIMINEDMSQIKLIDIGEATESKKDDEIELECVGSPAFMSSELYKIYK